MSNTNPENMIHEVAGVRAPDMSKIKTREDWLKLVDQTFRLIRDKDETEVSELQKKHGNKNEMDELRERRKKVLDKFP